MRKNNKLTISLIALVLLVIGIGYAYLTSNLSITGSTKIASNTWDIHFENVIVNPNSVAIGNEDSAAVINPSNNTEVTYEVTLNKPGDFYEFNVDVKNFGTIDGMIESINSTLKINNGEPFVIEEDNSNLPAYLNYSITYSDDSEILANHKLSVGEKETYKVRVEFKEDIDESELPNTSNTFTFGVKPIFRQATVDAVEAHPVIFGNYVVSRYIIENGKVVPEHVNVRENVDEALADWVDISFSESYIFPFFLKYDLDDERIVNDSYIGLLINERFKEMSKRDCNADIEECIQSIDNLVNGLYFFKGGDSGEAYESNVNTLKRAYNYDVQPDVCYFDNENDYFSCGNGWEIWNISVLANGEVNASSGGHHCNITASGISNCDFQ